jgi:hypothetical protein
MIIDYTYFTGLLSIGLSPDTGAPSTTRDAEREKIEYYITVYEREYLRKILGENMCGEFIDYLNSEEDNVDKWEKLLALLSEKYSPIACYIFFKYIKEGNYSVTRVGTVTSADDDAVSPMVIQMRAWNDMVDMNKRVYQLLQADEYEGVRFDPSMICRINSMGI